MADTILDKDPAVMFACFEDLPKVIFDKKKAGAPPEKQTNPRRLLLQQFQAVADKKHFGSKSSALEVSRKGPESSERSGQDSIFRQQQNNSKDFRMTKATNLYRISVTSKRLTHKVSFTGMNYSLKSIVAPPHLRHKPSLTTRIA